MPGGLEEDVEDGNVWGNTENPTHCLEEVRIKMCELLKFERPWYRIR